MARIKNRNNVPSIQIVWRSDAPRGVVEWRTATEPFESWARKVWAFCDANGIGKPSEDALDQLACEQFPKHVCDGAARAGAVQNTSSGRSAGCGSCGGRRK
jgi:hypothetical protein